MPIDAEIISEVENRRTRYNYNRCIQDRELEANKELVERAVIGMRRLRD